MVRSGLPESWHFGAAAVVAPAPGDLRLVARLGDPRLATYRPEIRNHRGILTGEVVSEIELVETEEV